MRPSVHGRRSPPTVVLVARSRQLFLTEGRDRFGNNCPAEIEAGSTRRELTYDSPAV
jgi:hypothetical protein